MGDRVQLQQVMMNLMINGGMDGLKNVDGRRELTIKSQRAGNEQLPVSVSDTGVGLSPQQTNQIFDTFFTTKPAAPAWDFASAAPSLNRMAAPCGLLTTLRATQAFVSRYPPRPRHAHSPKSIDHQAAHSHLLLM
jgi:hypothetical protein